MTRLVLAFAFVAATSGAVFADAVPGDDGAKPNAAPATTTPPPKPTPKARNVPPYQLDQAKISGENPQLPDAVKAFYAMAGQVSGLYKMCVDTNGDVAMVTAMQSIPDGDDAVIATLRTWKFKPQPDGAICSMQRFVFKINGGGPPPPEPRAASGRSGNDLVKVSGEQPHLPDRLKIKLAHDHVRRVTGVYQICVGHDGHVESVKPIQSIAGGDEAIMTTLRTWTFQPPQKVKTLCSPSVFSFDIG